MSPRTMKSLVKFTAAASVLSAAAATVSAVPASASTPYVLLFGNRADQQVICTPNTTHGAQSYPDFGFFYVSNNCAYRVWLQGNSGWTFCTSPGASQPIPNWAAFPAKIGISSNKAPC
jgi:hypothetical protein